MNHLSFLLIPVLGLIVVDMVMELTDTDMELMDMDMDLAEMVLEMVMELMGMDMDPAVMVLDMVEMGTLAMDVLWDIMEDMEVWSTWCPLIGGAIRGYDSRFVNVA
ncbi:hypothetical protein CEXT_747131 [Caerostris extrusa]|uniref:Uncharacterized protein n=1 Tax=Caerostris extrusa TaxID=172846 RepID=A0AAV4Y967_CAEEX|nr:hypothetical protein CEXT_747131 [Caerostris extrusa]